MKNRTTAPYIALTVMLLAGYPSIANASWLTSAFHSVSHAVTGVANSVANVVTKQANIVAHNAKGVVEAAKLGDPSIALDDATKTVEGAAGMGAEGLAAVGLLAGPEAVEPAEVLLDATEAVK